MNIIKAIILKKRNEDLVMLDKLKKANEVYKRVITYEKTLEIKDSVLQGKYNEGVKLQFENNDLSNKKAFLTLLNNDERLRNIRCFYINYECNKFEYNIFKSLIIDSLVKKTVISISSIMLLLILILPIVHNTMIADFLKKYEDYLMIFSSVWVLIFGLSLMGFLFSDDNTKLDRYCKILKKNKKILDFNC